MIPRLANHSASQGPTPHYGFVIAYRQKMTLDVFQTATSEILGAKNEVRLVNAKNPEALGLKSKTEALSELKFQLQFDLAKDVYVPY